MWHGIETEKCQPSLRRNGSRTHETLCAMILKTSHPTDGDQAPSPFTYGGWRSVAILSWRQAWEP